MCPCLSSAREKAKAFIHSPLRSLSTNTETSAKPHAFVSTFCDCCKTSDCKGLCKVHSQVCPALRPDNTHRSELNIFYCTAGAGWKGRAIQNARPTLQHGISSWETEKVFRIAPWFIRNNSKVDTTPTFHPTHSFITKSTEMQALRNWIPSPTFLLHKASCWILSVTSATAWITL